MRLRLICLFVLAFAVFGIAATWKNGVGGQFTATTNVQKQDLATTVNTLSIFNNGADKLFVLVDCTTNVLMAAIVANTAIMIPTNTSFTFDAQGKASIPSFCYGTTNATTTFLIAGY